MKPNKKLKLTRIPKMDAGDVKPAADDTIDTNIIKEEQPVSFDAPVDDTVITDAAPAENVEAAPDTATEDTVVFTPPDDTVVFDPIAETDAETELASEYTDEEAAPVEEYYSNELSAFDCDLETLSAEDIDPEGKGKRSGFPLFTVVRTLMILICLSVFVYCAFIIGKSIIDYSRTDVIYNNLADEFFSLDNSADDNGSIRMDQVSVDPSIPTTDNTTGSYVANGGTYVPVFTASDNPFDSNPDKMIANLEKLKEKAPDLYGWVYIDGTKINYPIVQGGDNSYYLNHAPNGTGLQTGSIFADFRCADEIMRNFNTVLYGHNIRSGSMFHDVEKFYKDEQVFMNSQVIVCTFTGIYYFEPFSVFQATYDSGYNDTGFITYDAFIEFAQRMQDQSVFNKRFKFDTSDRLLTLSTCTNGIKTDRYALMCILVDYVAPTSNQ